MEIFETGTALSKAVAKDPGTAAKCALAGAVGVQAAPADLLLSNDLPKVLSGQHQESRHIQNLTGAMRNVLGVGSDDIGASAELTKQFGKIPDQPPTDPQNAKKMLDSINKGRFQQMACSTGLVTGMVLGGILQAMYIGAATGGAGSAASLSGTAKVMGSIQAGDAALATDAIVELVEHTTNSTKKGVSHAPQPKLGGPVPKF